MIGIYDSGVGGLSVWKELISLMPGEDYVYFSDKKYCPYGPKDPEIITERAAKITDFFISKKVELIVVACNTATAAAISFLRSHYSIPFVGMEPAVKPAVLNSKSGVVGVLATAGTLKGRLYLDTMAKFAGDVKVVERVGVGLVEAVEKGVFQGEEVERLVSSCIEPMLQEGADHIVLGCTHYPFLESTVKKVTNGRASIVNPAPAVARQTKRVLESLRQTKNGTGVTRFYSSGDTCVMESLVKAICPHYTSEYFQFVEV